MMMILIANIPFPINKQQIQLFYKRKCIDRKYKCTTNIGTWI